MQLRVFPSVLLAVLMAALALLAACSVQPVQPTAPELHFGEDICSDCGMIINDPRFAASYAVQQEQGAYETFIFDDVGDMLKHMQENVALTGVGWWVHDYTSEEWIDAATAFYVVSDQIKTPMNSGIAAFASQEAAGQFAAELAGQVFDWDKIRIEHAMSGHHH